MTQQEFEKAVELHQKWRREEDGGERFDFVGVDFVNINFSGADLRDASFIFCNFYDSDMHRVDLSFAHIENCNFSKVNLENAFFLSSQITFCEFRETNLRCAFMVDAVARSVSFRGVILSHARIDGANFSFADLSGAILHNVSAHGTNFSGAKLKGAKIDGMHYNSITAFFAPLCPEEGSFIGFKKCRGEKIVKLLILEDAKRINATTRKCRCDKAKVLEITDAIDKTITYNEATSFHDADFCYRVGEEVRVNNFNDDRWTECSEGIHFFLTRDEAVKY